MKTSKFVFNSLDNLFFVSGGMLIQVISAIYMGTSDFGLFTAVFTIFIFAQTLSLSFIHEPFIRFYSLKNELQSKKLLLFLVTRMLIWSLPFFIFGAICVAFDIFKISWINYFFVFISLIASILFQFIRRINHFTESKKIGVFSSFIFLSSISFLLFFILLFDAQLDFVNVLGVIGVSALISLAYNLWAANILSFEVSQNVLVVSEKLLNFKTGLIVFSGNAIFFAISNFYVLMLPIWGTLDDVAKLRMIFIVLIPLNHLVASLNTLVLPMIKRNLSTESSLMKTEIFVLKWLAVTLLIGVFYGLLITKFFPQITLGLFDKDFDLDYMSVFLISALPVLSVMNLPFNMYLRVIGLPHYVTSSAMSTFIALILIVLLPLYLGIDDYVQWFLFSYVMAYFTGTMASGIGFFMAVRRKRDII